MLYFGYENDLSFNANKSVYMSIGQMYNLLYGAGIWRCNNEMIRKIGVSFNNAIRKVFYYRYFESLYNLKAATLTLSLQSITDWH
jgi:hypothetical protein